MWSNWSRGQSCAPAEHVRPGSRAELAAAVARGRAVRVAGAGHSFSGGVATDGTLLSLERARPRARRRPRERARARRGRHPAAPARARAARPRPRAAEPRRHRRAVARRRARRRARTGRARGSATSSSGVEAMELVLADGSERDARRRRRAARRARRARRARSRRGGHPALRARLPPARRRPAAPARRGARLARRARRGQRPLRAVHVPALAARADAHEQPHRRAADAAPAAARVAAGRRCIDNHAFWLLNRAAAARAARDPAHQPARPAARPRKRERVAESFDVFASPRLVRFEEMEYALPRARAAEAVRGVPRDPRAPPGLVPDRAALLGRRRRAALARARARDAPTSRCTSSRAWRSRRRSARSRR